MLEPDNLRLGEFIAAKLKISEVELNKLFQIQKDIEDKIGDLAVRENLITEKQKNEILAFRDRHNVNFGNAAVCQGAMKYTQVKYLLDIQAKNKLHIGDLLVQKKIVAEDELPALLGEFYAGKKTPFTILGFLGDSLKNPIEKVTGKYHYRLIFCDKEEELPSAINKLNPQLILFDEEKGQALKIAQSINESIANKPIKIALLASTDARVAAFASFKVGIDYFLPLPFDPRQLLNILIDTGIQIEKKSKKCILVVDDSHTMRNSIAKELKEEGFHIILATNGKEAVETALQEKPDLITMDIDMPVMDGYQACRELKKKARTSHIPIIILTSKDTREERAKGFEVGATEFFTKKFTKGRLNAYVQRLLRAPGTKRTDRIIAADDSKVARSIYKMIFNEYGFENKILENGLEVIDLLESGYAPSCVLLDYHMPEMDGFRTCQLIKESEKFRNIPVILVTGTATKETIIEALKMGADDYIPKPFDRDELMARIETHLKNFNLLMNQKKMNEKLESAAEQACRANEAKSVFLSSMSHELRTPLNAILGFSQLLESDPNEPLSQVQKENVEQIIKSGKHLLELINEILDLSQIEAGKLHLVMEAMDAASVVEDVIAMVRALAEKRNIKIANNIKTKELFVLADRTRFKQVLMNLLSNAVKYNRESGSVAIWVEEPDENTRRICVEDTGPGIASNELEYLFEPFNRLGAETLKIEGTGIGLTITKNLVESMGGSIGVKSELGKGTMFLVDFARAAAPSPKSPENDIEAVGAPQTGEGEKKVVLYVEDNKANLKLVANILRRRTNIELLSAPEAQEGINLAVARRPDLILMDINLPGMNGYEAFQILKNIESVANIPIVAVSASAMSEDIEKGNAMGFAGYITKPIHINQFLGVLDKILRK